jgi:hypothetical protein
MGLTNHYLKDRARIKRPVTNFNRGIVSQEAEFEPIGDWIPARIRSKSGLEVVEDGRVVLPEDYELVLAVSDINGNRVQIEQADRFEIMTNYNTELDYPVLGYKIDGAITETRKVTKLVSYVIPVVRDTEF